MTEGDLLHLSNFGDKSLQELRAKLDERGVRLGAPPASSAPSAPAAQPAPVGV